MKKRIQDEDIWDQCAEEDIWIKEGGDNRKLEEVA